ncbi:hypothetical protein HN51_063698 [Arachis hypogaea]
MIQGPEIYSCLKLLTANQVDNSAVVIPLKFAQGAFPLRLNHVKVVMDNGFCYSLGLRWSRKRKVQLYLTRGWKSLAKINGFRVGTVLRFSVCNNDETTLYIKVVQK